MPNALKAFLMSLGSGQLDLTAPYYRAMDAAHRRKLMEQKQRQFEATLPIRQSQADAAMMGARTSAGRLGFDVKKYTEEPGREEKKHQTTLTEIQARDLDPQAIAEMRGDVGPPPSIGHLQKGVGERRAQQKYSDQLSLEAAKTSGFKDRQGLKKDPQLEMTKRAFQIRYYNAAQADANLEKIVAAGRAKGEDWPDASVLREANRPFLQALKEASETGVFVPVGTGVAPQMQGGGGGAGAPRGATMGPPQPTQAPSPFTPAGKPTISRGQAKEIMDQLIQAGTAPDYDTAAAMVDQAYTIQKE